MKIKITAVFLFIIVLSISSIGCVSKSQYEQLEEDYKSLESELNSVRENYNSLQEDYTALESELQSTNQELSELREENSNLQNEITLLENNLTSLENKYPPRLFKDVSELEDWLVKQPNPPASQDAIMLFKHARDLQSAAAKDGYIISADFEGPDEEGLYYVWCSAVLEDYSYYYWDPDTDNISFLMDVRYFS